VHGPAPRHPVPDAYGEGIIYWGAVTPSLKVRDSGSRRPSEEGRFLSMLAHRLVSDRTWTTTAAEQAATDLRLGL
jgi:hypothetical protein